MKRLLVSTLFILCSLQVMAQCAMCTKTAASLDDKAAKGLNSGILYLAFMPMTLIIVIGYRWWKTNRNA